MDEGFDNNVVDDSGSQLHGSKTRNTSKTVPGKFSHALKFDGISFETVRIENNPVFHFGTQSFSFTAWIKINDYTYPRTSLAVKQGNGCYFRPTRPGFTAGWDIGHGHQTDRTQICIRDHLSNVGRTYIKHDANFPHTVLRGKWVHYGVVFDRRAGKVFLYLNGQRQKNFADIEHVTGSIDNKLPLEFGTLYGWKTDGSIDEYRLYNIALSDYAMQLIYNDHRV